MTTSRVLHALVRRARGSIAFAVVFTLGACSGDAPRAPASAREAAPGAATTPARPPASSGSSASSASSETAAVPRDVIAKGDSIFHGLVAGGTCQVCHGAGGTGGTLAPDLTDATWLHGDGSRAFLVRIVTAGVAAPKQYPAPMPPMGGASLSASDVHAVAAYVSSLRTGQSPP